MDIKFKREYINDDGSKDVWHFDLNKSTNGPILVELSYARGTKTFEQEQDQKGLHKTKQKYLNEKNGKYVSYQRAKALGIV
jgi:hypothetical protein